MQEKFYWQSFAELDPEYDLPKDQKEFSDDLPVLEGILEPISDNQSNRRDFLKTLGFTVGAASLAASCSIPEKKSIPYVNRPEEIAPGIASYYASVYAQGGDYVSILVKNRDGRPIKIEGNPESVISKGGTTALAQASIVTLYDSTRYQQPIKAGQKSDWKTVDAEIQTKLAAANGTIALVTSTIMSPSTLNVIASFKAKYPNAVHITHDAISYSGLLDAAEKSFGKRTLPDYKFGEADVILSIGADFLASWINPVQYAKEYSLRRKVSKDSTNMSKHIHVESVPSASSVTSDEKYVVSPSEEARFIGELYSALTSGTSSKISGVNEVKESLLKAKAEGKKCLIVNGTNDVNAQILTFAVNQFVGAIGQTVSVGKAVNYKKGSQADMAKLVADMQAGSVYAVLFLDCNPVYSMTNGADLAEKIKKLPLSVSFAERIDETSAVCQFICPNSHFLESWNDYEPTEGVYAIGQPVISPLYDTRQAQQSLMNWAGLSGTYYDLMKSNAKNFQSGDANFDGFWAYTVMKGESGSAATTGSASFSGGAISEAIAKLQATYPKSKLEVKFYSSIYGDGSSADNPFMQELPDPISRMTWGNYFIANPADVKAMGAQEVLNEKKYTVLKAKINGKEVSLPVVSIAGVAPGTLGMKMGFGRSKTSHVEYQHGANAFALLENDSNIATKVEVTVTSETEKMASVQSYFTLKHMDLSGEERTRHLIKETTLAEYKADPEAGNTIGGKPRREWIDHHLVTLYPTHENPGHKWGMVIDLNSCVGCGACVVACNIENNVPVVGKKEVHRSHDMHWLRIDRYHTGDINNPDVTFQPMLCQHCDNAPCENVCPVSATNHSTEGINQMAYNRCIGTRYCANNCPYKVRRFNWFDYQGADAWGASNDEDVMNRTDSVARMVLNPDVVTRSRGVIEKCSFCTQKIQASKLEAKKEQRLLADGDIVTACQSACPTNAITFGDVNNKESAVSKLAEDERAFGVIEEIYTKPNVTYLTKVRNREIVKKA